MTDTNDSLSDEAQKGLDLMRNENRMVVALMDIARHSGKYGIKMVRKPGINGEIVTIALTEEVPYGQIHVSEQDRSGPV